MGAKADKSIKVFYTCARHNRGKEIEYILLRVFHVYAREQVIPLVESSYGQYVVEGITFVLLQILYISPSSLHCMVISLLSSSNY